jgi:pimeloyl-ACP methyl ester carboxylesterase
LVFDAEATMRPMTDVVVLLPGITGSVLRDSRGRDLWAPTAGAAARALVTLGRSITDLELRGEDADDGVTAPMMVPDLHLIPGLWKVDGYSKISGYLQQQFAVTPGKNFFAFPYDWRRDNRVAARRLKEQADRWLWEWRHDSPDAKIILVGHSMGGLVARYFLECLEGWRDTRRLVTFGTPYRGVAERAQLPGPRGAETARPDPGAGSVPAAPLVPFGVPIAADLPVLRPRRREAHPGL